jgi:hypothetical protein
MAHYAFLDENNIVIEVIAGKDETELIDGLDPETWYANFKDLTCKRTSYNGNIRGKYAGIGDTYLPDEDIFIAPKPFTSWVKKGAYWYAPIKKPINDLIYVWDEPTLSWKELSIE